MGESSARASRAELARRLAELAASTPPKVDALEMGACCYDMAIPMGTVDVVCTECGAKTTHEAMDTGDLDECERLVQALARTHVRLDARLDNSDYCASCRKAREGSGEEAQGLVRRARLILRYSDGVEPWTADVEPDLLRALVAFLDGHDRVADDFGEESPLKRWLPKLRSLLGIEEKGD